MTIVVASDHGFTSLDYEVHCNTWLEENGWLSYEDDDHDALSDIDEDSKAYSLIPGRFFVNLEGREPRGSVPQSEYEAVRDELKAELEALEVPTASRSQTASSPRKTPTAATTTTSHRTSLSSRTTAST